MTEKAVKERVPHENRQKRARPGESGRGGAGGTWLRSRRVERLRQARTGAPVTAQRCDSTSQGRLCEKAAKQGGTTVFCIVLGIQAGGDFCLPACTVPQGPMPTSARPCHIGPQDPSTILSHSSIRNGGKGDISHGTEEILYHHPHLLPL